MRFRWGVGALVALIAGPPAAPVRIAWVLGVLAAAGLLVGAAGAQVPGATVDRPGPARKADERGQPPPGRKADERGQPAGRKAEERGQPVTVDADKMERFGRENLVVFTGNVVARQDGSVQYADRMEVYLDEGGDRILRTVSTGNIKIVTKDCRFGTALRAEYFEPQKLARLIGNARVWQEDNVVTGDTIDFYVAEDRAVVQGGPQGRVKAQFFPRDESRPAAAGAAPVPRPATPCPS